MPIWNSRRSTRALQTLGAVVVLVATAFAIRLAQSPRKIAQDRSTQDLIRTLAIHHKERDENKILSLERDLIARGKTARGEIARAFEDERSFNVKVSLDFVLHVIDGSASATTIIDELHHSADPARKMRLVFVLCKPDIVVDVPWVEGVARSEPDPMIRKYMIRMLASRDGEASEAATRLRREFNDTGGDVRIDRGRVLPGDPENDHPAQFLKDLIATESSQEVRAIAIRALAHCEDRDATPILRSIAESPTELIQNRICALDYFARKGGDDDGRWITALQDDKMDEVLRLHIRLAQDAIKGRQVR